MVIGSIVEEFEESGIPFRHREMEELIFVLTSSADEFPSLLNQTDLSKIGEGNEGMKQRVKSGDFLEVESPKTRLAILFRAYPNAAKKLSQWALGDVQVSAEDPIMTFFAVHGLLYERATRPADFVYQALEEEVPEPLNRTLNQRQQELSELQQQALGL